jgi:hypothetical protein
MEVNMEMTRENVVSHRAKKNKLSASVIKPQEIPKAELKRMHQLFLQYYENHPYEIFQRDLFEKDDVILLKDEKTLEIQGFSTILKVKIQRGNKTYYGIYSGDTLVVNEHWGSPALGVMFLKYLWWQKIKNPFRPLYWFLISKGYKTYLLMANNFKVHFPRYEKITNNHHLDLMNSFYGKKFNDTYVSEKDLIIPKGETCHLKFDVAAIDEKLLALPRIHYFQKKNPNWQRGVELCCIAEMTLFMPIKYSIKKFFKGLFK